MVRNGHTTTATGLRKNRVTQKTRLHVVRGPLDPDALVLDDEEERNKVLASQGVDAEDANEHHLQAVLNGYRKPATHSAGKQTEAHIPTPDAAGIVENYEALYASGKYRQPTTHLRFSETVEEIVEGGLAGGFTYFMDERDAEWLDKSNQEARGEGTSASANSVANGTYEEPLLSSTRSGRRTTRGKGKESEYVHAHAHARVAVDEDEFELVMGLFEKLTEEKFPFIHLALDNFPPFADYEPTFGAPLPLVTFASYLVPASVPPPERLVLVAHTVYPHWKARKVEREGQRVVPQLDYDDSQESSYICFRRRDVKPVRRTRASSSTYTDKLTRLRAELQMGLDIAKMVVERETLKMNATSSAEEVWQTRRKLVESWESCRPADKSVEMGSDTSLLFDRERVAKRPRVESLGRIILGPTRRPTVPQSTVGTPSTDQHSPLTAHLDLSTVEMLSPQGYVAIQSKARDRYREVQARVDQDMAGSRDNKWEDVLDLPYQSTPVPPPEKFFLACPPQSRSSTPFLNFAIDPAATLVNPSEPSKSKSPLPSTTQEGAPPLPGFTSAYFRQESEDSHESATPAPERTSRSLRLRTGRGGRLHFDRRLHTHREHPLLRAESAQWPRAGAKESLDGDSSDWDREEKARWEGREWRPKRVRTSKMGDWRGAPGGDYWQHPSVHPEKNAALRKRKRDQHEEEGVIGFEHCEFEIGVPHFTEWEKGPAIERESRPEPRPHVFAIDEDEDDSPMDGKTAEEVEYARQVEERWRYDADVSREEEDRYILDDYQPKFLRTTVTLLDAEDQDILMTDAKFLAPAVIPDAAPKPTRSSSNLGEQERSRLSPLRSQRVPSLQLQPPPMLAPQHLPVHVPAEREDSVVRPREPQTPPQATPTPPLSLPQIATNRMDEQIRRMARQTPSVSPTAAPAPQMTRRMSLTQPPPNQTPPQPNSVPLKPTPFTNGISGDNGATVRVSSPVRPIPHTPSPQHPQQSQQAMPTNGSPSHNPPNNRSSYTSKEFLPPPMSYGMLRKVIAERVPGAPTHEQLQARVHMRVQAGKISKRPNNVNLQMGPGSLNLKLPPSLPGQPRMNGTGGGDVNMGVQPVPMHPGQPRPNGSSPIPHNARGPPVNGHLLTPINGRASPANSHLLGRVSPMAHGTLTNSPHHHHSHLVPHHPSPPQPRPDQVPRGYPTGPVY